MDEETPSPTKREIPLTQKERDELAYMLQWPEDREAYRRLITPTPLTELPL